MKNQGGYSRNHKTSSLTQSDIMPTLANSVKLFPKAQKSKNAYGSYQRFQRTNPYQASQASNIEEKFKSINHQQKQILINQMTDLSLYFEQRSTQLESNEEETSLHADKSIQMNGDNDLKKSNLFDTTLIQDRLGQINTHVLKVYLRSRYKKNRQRQSQASNLDGKKSLNSSIVVKESKVAAVRDQETQVHEPDQQGKKKPNYRLPSLQTQQSPYEALKNEFSINLANRLSRNKLKDFLSNSNESVTIPQAAIQEDISTELYLKKPKKSMSKEQIFQKTKSKINQIIRQKHASRNNNYGSQTGQDESLLRTTFYIKTLIHDSSQDPGNKGYFRNKRGSNQDKYMVISDQMKLRRKNQGFLDKSIQIDKSFNAPPSIPDQYFFNIRGSKKELREKHHQKNQIITPDFASTPCINQEQQRSIQKIKTVIKLNNQIFQSFGHSSRSFSKESSREL